MKIAYNPTDKPNITSEQLGLFNKDIIFDLSGLATYARGVQVGKVYQKFLKSTNSTTIGYDGLVPFPDYNSNSKNRFLKEDGTWCIPNAETLNGYPESNFFRYRGDINSAYVDLTNYEKNAENFASYNPGMYNILKNGHSELFINFAKNIGSTSSLELKTSYNNDDYLYIRKVIDNNRVSGAWRPLAFADNTVRSVTLNNNLLRINTNGTNNDLTIPYATNTSNIISSKLENSNSYGSETGISWSLASSTNNGTYGTAIDSNGFNVNNNANGILWLGTHKASTNGGYGGQLGISSNSNIYYRYISNGSFPNAWDKIVFERDLIALNIKLTGYLFDANNFESITSNDTVSSALSKLECKTLFVYDWLMSDTDDTDEKINKWHEVEHFLERIEETTLNSILNTKADKETTLAGYGITDAMPYLGTVDANSVKSSGYTYVTANGAGGNGSLIAFGGTSYQTQLYADYLGGNLYWRVNANGTYTSWAKIATKGTTLAHYGIIDAVKYCYGADDIRHSASGYTQITHGGKVNGMLLSGIYKETSLYGGQLNGAFDGSSIWYRGLNNGTFTEWKRLAFKETTLSGYGITDAVPFLNMVNASNLKSIGMGYVNANGANGENGGIISFGSVSHQTQIHSDHSGGNIHWRVNNNGSLTNWKNLLDSNNYSNYAVTLGTEQIVTGHKTFKNDGYYTSTFNSTLSDGKVRLLLLNNGEAKLMLAYDGLGSFLYDYGSAQTLRIQNDGDLLFTKSIIASSQLKSNVATGTAPLVVNSTTMVANLNANYLGGLNKDSFQKAVYDYVNVSDTADTTALPTVLAPSNYNGANYLSGNFKFYDTKFYNGQSNTSNRCQLAYGYDVDSIHFRRYYNGTWYDWKKVVFTEGTDNLKITNSSARTTYVKDSTHSMFFGYSDGSYNRGLYDNSLSNWIMYTDSSNQTFINQWLGNVGIKTGNATLTAALQVGGSILASGDITAYSDRRLKSNIQTLENRGYVEPVTFEKDGKQCIGFIAQDVEEKYPELVNSEGEYLSLNYQQYTAVLQALIIELDKRIKELENGFSKL